MSYEYTITFKPDSDILNIISRIDKLSEDKGFYCSRKNGRLYIKDPSIPSSWEYDIFVLLNGLKMEITLVGWSRGLYDAFKSAINIFEYNILDGDSEEQITLEQLFRIN